MAPVFEDEEQRGEQLAEDIEAADSRKLRDTVDDVIALGVDGELEQLREVALVVDQAACLELKQRLEKADEVALDREREQLHRVFDERELVQAW